MKMKKIKLSLVLATYNEEENIKDCLESVKGLADEVVLIDGSSSDQTAAIARQMGARAFVVPNQMIFHRNKQLGMEKAKGSWILQLDADERVTLELKEEIKKVLKSKSFEKKSQINGYYLPRKNFFLGKFLQKGGQFPDYVIRLVKKGKARFPCQSVHEQIRVDGETGYLENHLVHFSAPTFSRYLKNANRYTTLKAQELSSQNVSLCLFHQLKYMVWLPLKTFFKIYLRHKGFLDGFSGFVFALFSGLHHLIAFVKYWEKKKTGAKFLLSKDWE